MPPGEKKRKCSAHPENLDANFQSVPVFSRNVLLRVEIQKDLERVQPSGQHVPRGLLGSLRMLIFDHIKRLDTLTKDGYRARTRQGRMLLNAHISVMSDGTMR
jgi:hypothetical protein